MRLAVVVILKVCRQHSAQVTLIEDDDVIEAFAADRADDALDIGVLPWRSRCGDDLSLPNTPSALARGARSGRLILDDRVPEPASPRRGLAVQDAGAAGS